MFFCFNTPATQSTWPGWLVRNGPFFDEVGTVEESALVSAENWMMHRSVTSVLDGMVSREDGRAKR